MSEIQPSLGELEDAQNTAYENFFTARDAVTAAGERVAAADEAVCLAEKKYMNGEISVEEWEATLQELSCGSGGAGGSGSGGGQKTGTS